MPSSLQVLTGLASLVKKKKAKPDGTTAAEPTQPKSHRQVPASNPKAPAVGTQPKPQPRQPVRDIDRQQAESTSEAARIQEQNRRRRAENAARRGT